MKRNKWLGISCFIGSYLSIGIPILLAGLVPFIVFNSIMVFTGLIVAGCYFLEEEHN